MIILLYGEDTFRSRQKLREIIEGYKAKHKSGLNLVYLEENELSLNRLKEKTESASMFEEKKLIILENVFKNRSFQEDFFKYAQKNKLKQQEDIILVLYEKDKLQIRNLKSRANIWEEFKPLSDAELIKWIKHQCSQAQIRMAPEAANKLIAYIGNDLWQVDTEINKLVNYAASRSDKTIQAEDVDLLVKDKMDLNIFQALDALALKNKKTAIDLLHKHLERDKNEIYLFSMLAYQVRTLLRLKDLAEKGTPYFKLSKETGIHPFVVKKSWASLKNFSFDQLKNIYRQLLKIDWQIKNGRIDGAAALDLLIVEI